MNCPRCHQEIMADAQFCPHCGYQLKKCPRCHQAVFENAKYCSHCGHFLENDQMQSSIGGYYVPIEESQTEEDTILEQQVDFKSIKVSKKVNKPVIIISVLILIALTIASIFYLKTVNPQDVIQNKVTELPHDSMKIDGKEENSSIVSNINQGGHTFLYKDRIYMCDDQEKLVSMKLDMSDQKLLLNEKVSNIYIVDDVIYYLNEKNFLCSIQLDGKDNQVIYNKAVYYMQVIDHIAYFQLDSEQEHIYSYDLTKQELKQVNKRASYNINIVKDKIYYTSSDGIYCIGINGQGDEKIVSGKCYGLVYQDKKLYYTFEDGLIYSYDTTNQKIEKTIDDKGILCGIDQNYLFFKTSSGISRYDFKTKETQSVYNGRVSCVEVVGDKLIVQTESISQKYRVIMKQNGSNQQRLFMSKDDTII